MFLTFLGTLRRRRAPVTLLAGPVLVTQLRCASV